MHISSTEQVCFKTAGYGIPMEAWCVMCRTRATYVSFPGGSEGKELIAGDLGSIPGQEDHLE